MLLLLNDDMLFTLFLSFFTHTTTHTHTHFLSLSLSLVLLINFMLVKKKPMLIYRTVVYLLSGITLLLDLILKKYIIYVFFVLYLLFVCLFCFVLCLFVYTVFCCRFFYYYLVVFYYYIFILLYYYIIITMMMVDPNYRCTITIVLIRSTTNQL